MEVVEQEERTDNRRCKMIQDSSRSFSPVHCGLHVKGQPKQAFVTVLETSTEINQSKNEQHNIIDNSFYSS